MSSKYKKIVLYFFLIIFSILIILKYSISILKNEILNIIKSDQFDTFIVNIIDQKVQKLAESKITNEKKKFYKENLNKILDKFDFK
tara:strand:- start:128 stop:385 length:258 start_codon:yes stop_codon:yes gene_type:complete